MYRVIKNYEARNSKELDLELGDALLSVKPCDDKIQAFGTLGTKTGYFPLECIEPCFAPNKQRVATLREEETSLNNDSTDSETEPSLQQAGPRNYTKHQFSRSNSNRHKKYQRNLSAPNQVQLPTGDESCGTDQSDDASNSLYRNRDPTSDVDIASVDHLLAQEGLLFTANKGDDPNDLNCKSFSSTSDISEATVKKVKLKQGNSFTSITHSISRTLSRENLALHAQYLSSSKGSEHMGLKIVFALIMSLLSGGIIFGSMAVSGSMTLYEMTYICSGFTLFSFGILLVSRKLRAVYTVMVPTLFAKRGQTVIMSLAFSLIFMGPVQSILVNMEEVASSISCHSELAYNQSLEIMQLYISPFGDIARQIGETVDKLESLEKYYKDPVNTIVKGLNETERKLEEIEKELGKYEGACIEESVEIQEQCEEVFEDLKTVCKFYWDMIATGITDPFNTLIDGETTDDTDKENNDYADDFDDQEDGDITDFPFEARMLKVDSPPLSASPKSMMLQGSKSKSNPCKFSDSDNYCEGARDIMHLSGCYPATGSLELAREALKLVKLASDEVIKQFEVKVDYEYNADSDAQISADAEDVEKEIVRKYSVMRPYLESFVKVSSLLMACFFLTVLYKAYRYISKFIQDVSFDNHYLNESLIERLNQQNKTLRKSQIRKLVRVTQWKRTPKENKRIIISIVTSAIYTTAALAILFFDIFLYYTLEIIQDNGHVEANFTGDTEITLEVQGEGLMRDIIGLFLDSYHSSGNLSIIAGNEKCLPNPYRPDNHYIITMGIIVLFMLFYFTVLTQTWVLRLRHIICCMFFEGTEAIRLTWLANKLAYEIDNRKYIMSKNVLKSFNESRRRKIYLEGQVFRKMSGWLSKVRGYCFICRETTWGKHAYFKCDNHFENGLKCSLRLVYCALCNKELVKTCVLCMEGIVDFDNFKADRSSKLLNNDANFETKKSNLARFGLHRKKTKGILHEGSINSNA